MAIINIDRNETYSILEGNIKFEKLSRCTEFWYSSSGEVGTQYKGTESVFHHVSWMDFFGYGLFCEFSFKNISI
jgi:hypothetical protein